MTSKIPTQKRQGKPRTELPDEISLGIGRLIVLWSYIEIVLRATVYNLLGVGSGEGRRAVREPRIKDTVMLIKDLIEINKVSVSGDLNNLAEICDDMATQRNSLAHGMWVDIDGVTYLQVTSGTWRDENNVKWSRKISPQGFIATKEDLATLLEKMSLIAGAVEGLGKQVHSALSSSPRKSRKLHPIYNLHSGHN